MADPSEPGNGGPARPIPQEWRSAITVAWINLVLAFLILPLIGVMTSLVGLGLYVNNVKRTLAVFFVVAGIASTVVFTITDPLIRAVVGDEAPDEVREFYPDGSDDLVIP